MQTETENTRHVPDPIDREIRDAEKLENLRVAWNRACQEEWSKHDE